MKRAVKAGLMLYALATPALGLAAWDGMIDWARRTELSTATSGVVDKVAARAGERVDKGTVLLQLEQDALRAAVDQGRSGMKHARLLREEAQKELDRAEELYARTLLADHDLDLAKIAYAEADAAYQASRAGYHAALQALRNSELKAPFDALVLARHVEPAQTVVSELRAEPLLVVAAQSERLVRFAVSAAEAARLSPGQAVTVEVAGKRYDGEIVAVTLDGRNGKGGDYSTEAIFTAHGGVLPGTAAKVELK